MTEPTPSADVLTAAQIEDLCAELLATDTRRVTRAQIEALCNMALRSLAAPPQPERNGIASFTAEMQAAGWHASPMHDYATMLSQRNAVIEALRELVACKDLKDTLDKIRPSERCPQWSAQLAEYQRRKPLAWAAARAALQEKRDD